MTPLGRLQRQARDAGFAADRVLTVGVVERIHPQVDASGDPNGRALYDVRIFSRRGRPYILRHVASAVPVQARVRPDDTIQEGHEVFVTLVGGQHSRGAWITGLVQPPVPQLQADTVDVSPFGTYAGTSQVPTLPGVANRLLEVEDAFVATAASMRLGFSLTLPAIQGAHEVVLTGLDRWDGEHTIHSSAPGPHTHTADDHIQHRLFAILEIGAAGNITGGLGGAVIQWQADARLLDGADLIGQSTHPFVGQGVITGGTVTDTASERRWRFTEQLLTTQAVWTGVFDTREVMGKPLQLEMYLVGSFVNPERVHAARPVGLHHRPGQVRRRGRGLRLRPAGVGITMSLITHQFTEEA